MLQRTPLLQYWRIRVFEKFNGEWQKSSFGWHWVQDMVYVFDRPEEVVINELMTKVERMLSNTDQYEAISIEIRYFDEIAKGEKINFR